MINSFQFEPRIEHASTPDSRWYFDRDCLEQEKQRIFSMAWQLVGRSKDVALSGQYLTAVVGEEPVLVARGNDGRLRAFSNVCRHRAGPVAEGMGERKAFQCGYHGWTYRLDGTLSGTPEFEGVKCFNKEDNGLIQYSVGEWNSLVFVNPNIDALPLSEYLHDLPLHLQSRNLGTMQFAARKDWIVECNWKVYVDNYLEGYHIPIVHPSLNREIDYAQYWTETNRYFSIQHSPLNPGRAERIRTVEDGGVSLAQFFWIFPNLMLNVYPDNYSTNLILPLGPERTLTIFEWYFHNPELPEAKKKLEETIGFSDEIQLEDIKICEAVQRGLRSLSYNRGRYSVKRENGVHHFHGLLSEFLNSD